MECGVRWMNTFGQGRLLSPSTYDSSEMNDVTMLHLPPVCSAATVRSSDRGEEEGAAVLVDLALAACAAIELADCNTPFGSRNGRRSTTTNTR